MIVIYIVKVFYKSKSIMNIVTFQKHVYNLPKDIHFILREYGVIQINHTYLITIGKLDLRKYKKVLKYARLHCASLQMIKGGNRYTILQEPPSRSYSILKSLTGGDTGI